MNIVFRIILVFSTFFLGQCSTTKSDRSYNILTEKGFLFFSYNNVFYIDSLKGMDFFPKPFIMDMFLPISNFDSSKNLVHNFSTSNVKTGIQMQIFNEREELFKRSKIFSNDSIISPCYEENKYNLLPVALTYKKWKNENVGISNCENTIQVYSDRRIIEYNFTTSRHEIISIKVLDGF